MRSTHNGHPSAHDYEAMTSECSDVSADGTSTLTPAQLHRVRLVCCENAQGSAGQESARDEAEMFMYALGIHPSQDLAETLSGSGPGTPQPRHARKTAAPQKIPKDAVQRGRTAARLRLVT
jgi:hypothetical protein